MAIVSQENINRWIEQSDIDYIGHYIKTWIPFNAWYNNNFQHLKRDRDIINAIKNGTNTVRSAINTLMEGNSAVSMEFKSYLASLHFHTLEANLEGRDGVINFNNVIKVLNTTNQKTAEFNQKKYFLQRTDGSYVGAVTQVQINVKKSSDNSAVFSYNHTDYDIEHLQNYPHYQSLTSQVRTQIRIYFQELKPFSVELITEDEKVETPFNYYKCDNFDFKRDVANTSCYAHIVVKALIEILYQLRNVVFHGELVPNKEAQKIYASAYHLLKIILEKLK